jgi:hypothetical protein
MGHDNIFTDLKLADQVKASMALLVIKKVNLVKLNKTNSQA